MLQGNTSGPGTGRSPGMGMMMRAHSVIGFLQLLPPLHLQYLQQQIPATRQGHPFLCAHLPHEQGSGKPSGFEITISGTNKLPFLTKP